MVKHKQVRYLYWLTTAFFQKNIRLIILSFLVSIITVVGILTISPYIISYATTEKNIIGIVGTIDFNSIPEEITNKVTNSLITINEKGQIAPVIATNWEYSKDGKEYRYTIRKNLFWNNGTKFTSHDLQYSFKDITVETPDDYHIVFKLKNPLRTFPNYLTVPIIKYPLIGVAGLYKVDRIKSKYGFIKEISFTPQKENIPALTYKFYDSEAKMISAYKLGEITEIKVNRLSVANIFTNWKNSNSTKTVDYSRLLTLFYNHSNELLKERDIRQAIALSIKKETVVDTGEEANGPIPPISWAYNPLARKAQENRDLAQKIVKKYSSDGKVPTFNLSTSYEYIDLAESIKEDLESTGFKVNIAILSGVEMPQFDLLLAYWKVPSDPDQYYFWHSKQQQGNISNYKNVRIDKLLEDGRDTLSIIERKKIYATFQRSFNDDIGAYFISYPYVYTVKRK